LSYGASKDDDEWDEDEWEEVDEAAEDEEEW
jgi:hypothetical protein